MEISNVKLYSGVPLDVNHDNIFISDSESAVLSALSQYEIFSQSNLYYIRAEDGHVKVEGNAENLYSCDYISFNNDSLGGKKFFGFVVKVEYINDITVDISYIIDDVTTWLPYCFFPNTFIERMHTATDNYFEWLQPENFELGEIVKNREESINLSDTNFILLTTMDKNKQPPQSYAYINGTFCGLNYNYYFSEGAMAQDLADYVGVQGLEDAIVTLYQTPSRLRPNDAFGEMTVTYLDDNLTEFSFGDGLLDDYRPRNKKLFSYPYVQIIMSNSEGGVAFYKPELWDDINNVGKFRCCGVNYPKPEVLCFPAYYYKGQQTEIDYGLVMKEFPVCAVAGNTYSRYWAQNQASIKENAEYSLKQNELNFVNSGINMTANALMGNAFGAAKGAVSGASQVLSSQHIVDSLVAKKTDLQNTPGQMVGHLGTASLKSGMGAKRFYITKATIRKEIAKSIDDYFTLFGYSINRIMPINLNVRPHWTYLKTVSMNVRGGIPADSKNTINAMFNKGVRVWNTMSEIGNYSLNNGV